MLTVTLIITFITLTIFIISCLLIKKFTSSCRPRITGDELSSSSTLHRQLHHLFHLHDSGLDQALVEALPVFLYKEIVASSNDPFDCAVCLVEFTPEDKLRLLPSCCHAFHIACIDSWLLSSSTCPLCRGPLFAPGIAVYNPVFDLEDCREVEERALSVEDAECGASGREERVLVPVKLGKFKNLEPLDDGEHDGADNCGGIVARDVKWEEGELCNGNFDARRCFSMGSYQYVVSDVNLRVALNDGSIRIGEVKGRGEWGIRGNFVSMNGMDDKRLSIGSRGESFSVSKIWQWSNKKGKLPIVSEDPLSNGRLSWIRENVEISER